MIANYRQAVPFKKAPEPDAHTLLLLHGEVLSDSSMYNRSLKNENVSISSENSKFGGSSFYFNGSSRILIPEPINFGSSDFTIEWWEYCSTNDRTRFCSVYTTGTNAGGLLIGYMGTTVYAASSLSGWDIITGKAMITTSLNLWTHWAFVRHGETLTSYKNGAKHSSVSMKGSLYYDEKYPMVVGDYRLKDSHPFLGYMDEIRISDVARWTEDFSPPEEPYVG